MKKPTLTQDDFKELLEYDPDSGSLTWRTRSVKWFVDSNKWTAKQACKSWNARYAGKQALASKQKEYGYLVGHILNQFFISHRVIWVIMTGEYPNVIDHINGKQDDNRWINLRSVSHADNLKNKRISSKNTSGATGVSRRSKESSWVAYIPVNRKTIYLGSFSTFEEAVAARKLAETEHGFHPNHGRK